jgi:hypothetical protein
MRSMSIKEFQSAPFAMLAETEGDDEEEETHANFKFLLLFVSSRFTWHRRLELAFVAAGDDDVVDLEHHAAQLGGEQELLALGDERVDDKGGLHVCGGCQ